jgi:hypothetical protein
MGITLGWQKITMVKSFITLVQGGKLKYRCDLQWYLNPRKCGYQGKFYQYFYNIATRGQCYKNTAVNYHGKLPR